MVSGIEDGNRLPSVPELQVAAAVTFHKPLKRGADGFFTTTYNHVGSRYTQIDDLGGGFRDGQPQLFRAEDDRWAVRRQSTFTFNPLLPAYNLVNLRVGVTRASWEAALFLNNVTDERALLALDRERGTRARVGYLTNQPRTLGLSLSFNY